MQRNLATVLSVATLGLAIPASAQVTFYEGDDFHGHAFTVDTTVPNFAPLGFNDRARSAIVDGGTWEVCEHAGFAGRCVVLRPGDYSSLERTGLYERISSVRPAGSRARYAMRDPMPAPDYSYYRRANERLYEAPVTSAHAVVGPPERRCWVERQQVHEDRDPNVPGAIAGAIIGGILGHQVGGGRGQDVATAGGAIAGAAIGANVGHDNGVHGRDVERCETVSNHARPDYWDVTYTFHGIEHRVQLTAPPGPTIAVNRDGEPRG